MREDEVNILTGSLTGITGLIFTGSALIKLFAVPKSATYQQFLQLDLLNSLILVGFIELIGAILFVVPQASSLGYFILLLYMGGTFATQIANGLSTDLTLLLVNSYFLCQLLKKSCYVYHVFINIRRNPINKAIKRGKS